MQEENQKQNQRRYMNLELEMDGPDYFVDGVRGLDIEKRTVGGNKELVQPVEEDVILLEIVL